MKKVIIILLMSVCSRSTFAQKQFILSGNISSAPVNSYIKLIYNNSDSKRITDSASLNNGSFSFRGSINEPTRAFVVIGKATELIYIEPTELSLKSKADLKDLKLSGSKTQDEYDDLHARIDEANKSLPEISANFNKVSKELNEAKMHTANTKLIDSLDARLTAIHKQLEPFAERYESIVRQYVINHPDSYVSANEMRTYAGSWTFESVTSIYNSFSDRVKNSIDSKIIKATIDKRAEHAANSPAPDFSKADVNGKTVSLAALKGKYVLLDFWGSWCVPCRESTPHLIILFNKYHRAGLEVVGIAADDKTQVDWKRAIKKDKTQIWYNILDGKFGPDGNDTYESLSDKYAVGVYPTKILVDKDGKIIDRFVGTEDTAKLDKILADLFSK